MSEMLICNWRYHKRRIIDGKISYILSIGCTSIHKSKVHGIGRTVTKCMVVVQVQVQVEESNAPRKHERYIQRQ